MIGMTAGAKAMIGMAMMVLAGVAWVVASPLTLNRFYVALPCVAFALIGAVQATLNWVHGMRYGFLSTD